MKEHFQDYGVRKWAGDDLIELQSESLQALQGLVEPYSPCIIKGCDVVPVDGANYKVTAGLVALVGKDADGNDFTKIARLSEVESTTLPIYLTMKTEVFTRVYSDGESKAIAYDYVAQIDTVKPTAGSYLEITADGGKRLVDTLGITQKLDRVNGKAQDTIVDFPDSGARNPLQSGARLGTLISLIKKWLTDLKTLAFKDKVAELDLEDDLKNKLNNKVDKVTGKQLSTNDFTTALWDKLNGIATNANNYIHPTTAGNKHIPAGGVTGQYLKYSASGTAAWAYLLAHGGTMAVSSLPSSGALSAASGIDTSADYVEVQYTGSGSTSFDFNQKFNSYWFSSRQNKVQRMLFRNNSATGTVTINTSANGNFSYSFTKIILPATAYVEFTVYKTIVTAIVSKNTSYPERGGIMEDGQSIIRTNGAGINALMDDGTYKPIPERGSVIFTHQGIASSGPNNSMRVSIANLIPRNTIPVANKDYILDPGIKIFGIVTQTDTMYAYISYDTALNAN